VEVSVISSEYYSPREQCGTGRFATVSTPSLTSADSADHVVRSLKILQILLGVSLAAAALYVLGVGVAVLLGRIGSPASPTSVAGYCQQWLFSTPVVACIAIWGAVGWTRCDRLEEERARDKREIKRLERALQDFLKFLR
jgi:hypothetical protein